MYIARLVSIIYFVIVLSVFFGGRQSGYEEENYPLSVLLLFSLPGFYIFFIGFNKKLRLFLSKYSNGIASLFGLILLILLILGVIDALTLNDEEELSSLMLFVFVFSLLFFVITWLYWLFNGDIDLEKIIKDGRNNSNRKNV